MTQVFLEPKPSPHLHQLGSSLSDPLDSKDAMYHHHHHSQYRKEVVATNRIVKLLPPNEDSGLAQSPTESSLLMDMRLKQSGSPENLQHCLTPEHYYRQ